MSTYKAWDGNDYPAPPPEGWYPAADDLWWPEGYGPGPATVAAPELTPAPAPAPPSSFEAPRAESSSFEAPRAESSAFDRDPTTIMPMSQPSGSSIPAHAMPAPGSYEPPPAGGPGPAPEPWAQPQGAAPTGFGAPAPQPMEWSEPPGTSTPPGYDTPASGKSSNKVMLIVAAGLLALIVAGGVGFALTRGGDDSEVVAFDPSALKGSAANPHTAGDLVRIAYDQPDTGAATEWTIEVMSIPVDSSTDGGDEVDATVDLRLALAEAGAPDSLSSLSFTAVGPNGRRTPTGDCAPLSTPLPADRLVSVGETVEGSVCWQVPAVDLGNLTMMVEVEGIDGQVYLRLQ